MSDCQHHNTHYAKLSVVSNCLQEPYKTDSMETSGEKASSRTESFNGRENDGNCTACASKRSRESSVFQLIVTPKDEKLVNCCSLHGIKRVLCFLMIVFLIAVLCTMTGLYISQKRKLTRINSVDAGRMDSLKIKTTTATPKMKPTLSNCVPVLNAQPLPSMPLEVANMIEGLNKEVEGLFKMYKLKAASVGFSYRGEMWWSKHVGSMNFSDINAPLPDNDTPYPVASITKLITAIMMHKLFEEGKIDSLDDPVKKYMPEFSVKNPFNKEKITLRQLSCMMSGLPREAPCFPPQKRDYCPFSSSEMMKKIANISLILPPDKNPSYSNVGYSILGSALEKIAGVPYEEWVTKKILKPLGMNNSGFDSVASAKKFPISTNLDGSIVDIVDWGWLKTSGGLYSSMNDLNQVAKMLFEMLNDTTVLHRNTARKLFKPAFLFNSGHGTGYSFEILSSGAFAATKHHSRSNLEHMIYAKSGAFFGYGALIALVPEFKLAAFSLVAHAGVEKAPGMLAMSPLKVMEPLEQVLLRSLPKYILPPSPSIYIGKYKLVQYWPLVTDLIEILMKGDTLYMKIQWLTVPLSYVSPLVLVTGHFGKTPRYSCEDVFLSSGLSHVKCNFRKPLQPGGKSPSFLVKGITTYGMAEFKRVSK